MPTPTGESVPSMTLAGASTNADTDCVFVIYGSVCLRRTLRGLASDLLTINPLSVFHSAGMGSFFGVPPVDRPNYLNTSMAGAINTGDAATDAILGVMRANITEIAAHLRALGLLEF